MPAPAYRVALPGILGPQFVGLAGAAAAPAPDDLLDRRDHSVNGAWVDAWNRPAPEPIFRQQTNRNPAGGYTGLGVGNKAILGHRVAAPLPLAALVSIEYTVTRLQPEAVGVNLIPYANLIVELAPAGPIVVLVFGDVASPLILGTYSSPGPNQTTVAWSAAADGVLVVLDEGMCVFPNPPGPVLVPVSQGPIQGPTAGSWQSHAYSIAGILAVYPGAQIVNADPVDGGLPSATILAGVLLCTGSSTNFVQSATRLNAWTLNGAPI